MFRKKIKKFRNRRKVSKLNYGVHENLTTAFLLSMVGGILDAHTFLFRNRVFANTQTGNIVFLALSLTCQNFGKTLNCTFSFVSFILGIFLTELLKHFYKNKILKFINIVLTTEIAFLMFLTFIQKNMLNSLVISLISFVCSLQTNSFRSLQGSPYASTMCTGNLRSASASFFSFVFYKNKQQGLVCFRYTIILFAFFGGAILGYFLTKLLKQFTILFCALLLLLTMILINFKHLSCS